MSAANKTLIRRVFDECLNRHNLDVYPELYSKVVYRAPATGVLHDEEHRHLLLSLFAGFSDAHWTIEDQLAGHDKVVTRWTFAGTHTGTFMGIEATGRQLHCTGVCIDRIVNGKIIEEWEEWDTLGVMQQLGVISVEANVADMVAP
jgi:predicted ester cyclase